MRYQILLAILVFTIPGTIKAIPIDSIDFQNEIEKELLINYSNGKEIEPVDLFTSFNLSDLSKIKDYKTVITEHIKEIENKGIENKKTKQKVQVIYKLTHDKYFKQYTQNAYFDEIFETGNYNCVTATSLYALLLNHFKIDYKIKKTPNHVYIEVKDLKKNILMESTFPQDGVFEYSDNLKKEYIDYLEKNKLLKSEDKELSVQEIFSQYFYSAEEINIYQLSSLQYYNLGLAKLNVPEFNEALINFEKCKILDNDNSNIDYLINISLLNILNNGSTDALILSRLIDNSHNNLVNRETTEYYFDKISKELINNNPKLDKYHSFFSQLTASLFDTSDLNNFRFKYYLYCGQYYEINGQLDKAVTSIGQAYSLNPTNLDAKKILLGLIDKHLREIGYRGEGIIKTVEGYFGDYPFLKDYNDLNNFRIAVYSCGIMDNLYRKDVDSALEYLPGFEKSIEGVKHNQNIMMTIGEVYCDLYRIHLINNKIEKANYYLKRGYELSPNNGVLKNCELNLIRRGIAR